MARILPVMMVGAFALSACDGANPFQLEATLPDGTTEVLEEGDPNTDINNRYAFDPQNDLTMNSVEYDAVNDELVINNLPFDGPDGRYDNVAGSTTTTPAGITSGIYESRQTATTGQIKHYAVFIQSDHFEATAAAGRDWGNFGNAGANINRDSFSLPASNEYVYVGVYQGTRTYSDRGGIELVTGDVELLLDIDDFDPNFPGDGLQGDIVGSITNRQRVAPGNTGGGDLPNVSLFEVSFNTETGLWDNGTVATYRPDGTLRDQGEYEGMIGGPNGEEMAGYVIMEGVADIQVVTYEIVTYSDGSQVTALSVNDQGLTATDLQSLVNNGFTIPTLTVPASVTPSGESVVSTVTETTEVETEYNAKEVGVFIGDQQ